MPVVSILGSTNAVKRQERSIFPLPGRVDVYCSIHTKMSCIVLVLPNPWFALSERNGRYVIRNVPAGTYRLRAWHARLPPQFAEVVVPAEGEVHADFVLGVGLPPVIRRTSAMSKSHPAIRMGFQTKVLVPVLALLVILPALTLLIVTHHIGEQMEAEANATLTTADGVFRQSVAIRQRSLISRFRNAVNEPRFRAVAGLGDVPTMSAFLGEALVEFGEETEFLAFTNQNGEPAGVTSRSAPALLEAFNRAVRAPAQRALEGEIVTGCVVLNHEIYDLIAVPVFSTDRRALNGVLTVAVQVWRADAAGAEITYPYRNCRHRPRPGDNSHSGEHGAGYRPG
jgi:hypothetical protein